MKFETWLLAAFVAAVLVLGLLLGSTIKVAHEDDAAAQTVTHTHETLADLRRVRSGVLLLETLTRGYLISGDADLLPQRIEAIAELDKSLQRVQPLTTDDAEQQQRWRRLREISEQRVAISNQLMRLRRDAGFDAAQAYFLSAPVEEIRELILAKLSEMTAAERELLAQQLAERQRMRQFVLTFDVLLALALTTLLAGTYVFIRRQLRAIESSRRALAESEQSLSTTLHSIGDAVLATDTQGCITRMNTVAEHLTGWPLAEALGRPVEEVFRILHEPTRTPAEVPIAKVLATGKLQGLANHTVLIARDGSECPIADSAAPIRDADGRVSGVVLVFRDVTLEQQVERSIREHNEQLEQRVQERTAKLHESEQRFRLLVDGARDYAIILLDPQGRVLTWNEGARRLKGYAEADILGQSLRRFYPPEDVASHKPERLLEQAVREGRCEDEGWRLRQDGSGFYANVVLTPIHHADGALAGYAKVTRDITERWRVQQQLQAEQTVLECISTGRPLDEILNLIARHVEALAPGALSSILLLDSEGLHLRCAAAPSLPQEFKRAFDGLAIGPQVGSCGTAAYRNATVIVDDIATDPLWADYAALALPLGLRAC